MATEDDISKIQTAFGKDAPAGTYDIGGRQVDYDGPGSEAQDTVEDGDKRRTPEEWDGPKDARELEGAGKYPNYYSHKTRSGHVFMMDDSEGAEHVTLQHRSGTMFQIGPTGTLNITAHNGSYQIVFGENRMVITGSHDITVQGDASLRVDGDYEVTAAGNINFLAQGDFNIASKNVNMVARSNIDMQSQNRTEKVAGAITQIALGSQTITGETGMTMGAMIGGTAIMGMTGISIVSKAGPIGIRSTSTVGIKSEGVVGIHALGAVTVRAEGALTMSGTATASLCSNGPLTLFGLPINMNLANIPAPISYDGLIFTHIPSPTALAAVGDLQGALDLIDT